MEKLYYLLIVLAIGQSGCLFNDDVPDNSADFVQYKFSSENQSNYTAPLTADEIARDLKSIKTIFTLLDMQDQMPLPMAKNANSLAKSSVEPECINMNQITQEGLLEEVDGLSDVSLSWTMSNGNPLVICQNDANPYDKLDNSLMTMSATMINDQISGAMKMNYLVDILRNGDKIEGMEMHFSAHIIATVMGAFNVEALMSGKIGGNILSGEDLAGNITMQFSILDGRYRCSTTLNLSASSVADEVKQDIQSCQITHNNQKVGTLDLSQAVPVILDNYGNPF